MDKYAVIKKTEEYVKKTLSGESSGHDWWHVYRVRNMAKHIGKKEQVDMFIVELGALLHDIADYKLHGGDEEIGPQTATKWLESLQVEEKDIRHISDMVRHISYKGAHVQTPMPTKEGEVVQDADRLDAIGAIGIARTFVYSGHTGRVMYDPTVNPVMHTSFEEYKKNSTTTINHFYEKLLLLKDRMHTQTAKQIAQERTAYMQGYLAQFYSEWEGQK